MRHVVQQPKWVDEAGDNVHLLIRSKNLFLLFFHTHTRAREATRASVD